MGPTAAVLLLLVKPLAACCASHCVRVANAYYLYSIYVLGIMLAKSCQLGQRKEGGGGLELKNFHPLK